MFEWKTCDFSVTEAASWTTPIRFERVTLPVNSDCPDPKGRFSANAGFHRQQGNGGCTRLQLGCLSAYRLLILKFSPARLAGLHRRAGARVSDGLHLLRHHWSRCAAELENKPFDPSWVWNAHKHWTLIPMQAGE